MALIVGGGEIILRVFDDGAAMLTVRSAEKEKAEVELTYTQSLVLVDMLGRVPGDGDIGDDGD